jgi:hypothetical protein
MKDADAIHFIQTASDRATKSHRCVCIVYSTHSAVLIVVFGDLQHRTRAPITQKSHIPQ